MATEYVYLGRDNTFSLALYADGVVLTDEQMDSITKVQLHVDSAVVEVLSATRTTGYIKWRFTGARPGEMLFDLGAVTALAQVSGLKRGYLVVFDASNTTGIVWSHFPINFVPSTSI